MKIPLIPVVSLRWLAPAFVTSMMQSCATGPDLSRYQIAVAGAPGASNDAWRYQHTICAQAAGGTYRANFVTYAQCMQRRGYTVTLSDARGKSVMPSEVPRNYIVTLSPSLMPPPDYHPPPPPSPPPIAQPEPPPSEETPTYVPEDLQTLPAAARLYQIIGTKQLNILVFAHPLGTLDRATLRVEQGQAGGIAVVDYMAWHDGNGGRYVTVLDFQLHMSNPYSIDSMEMLVSEPNTPAFPAFAGAEVTKTIMFYFIEDYLKKHNHAVSARITNMFNQQVPATTLFVEGLREMANSSQ